MPKHVRSNGDYFHPHHDLYLPPAPKGEPVCGQKLDQSPFYRCTREVHNLDEDCAAHGNRYSVMFARWSSKENK